MLLLSAALGCTGPDPAEQRELPPTGSELLTVTLTGNDEFEGGVAYVTVYGYDEDISDQSADRLAFAAQDAAALPVVVDVALPDDMHEHLTVGGGDPETVRYYAKVYVDVDGDGELCGDDLGEDYDTTDFTSYDRQDFTDITVPVSRLGQAGCEPVPTR